jgi:hypothetical protein
MNVTTFDPSSVTGFGICGQQNSRKMYETLSAHSLGLTFNGSTKKFTVLGSSSLSSQAIEQIFAEKRYGGWAPQVLEETDTLGNRLVQFRMTEEIADFGEPLFASPFERVPSRGASNLELDLLSSILRKPQDCRSRLPRETSPKVLEVPSLASPLAQMSNGGEIAEALQSEAVFTISTDKKPIVATYGCGPCVALGGYDATNKMAFVVHFASEREVMQAEGALFHNISKLAKERITRPIQIHLRGGIRGQSESTIAAIRVWMRQRSDLPMEIASQDILSSGTGSNGKSILIDSRNGKVTDYSPLSNPKHRSISPQDEKAIIMSAYEPKIRFTYIPEQRIPSSSSKPFNLNEVD